MAHLYPVMFGPRGQMRSGILRALAGTDGTPAARTLRVARKLPQAVRGYHSNFAAGCEVAQMLGERMGVPGPVRGLFPHLVERWDGHGEPGRLRGEEIPLPLRIVQVARDATFQHLLGGAEYAARVIRSRAGAAFDPTVAAVLAGDAAAILAFDGERPAWHEVLAAEPGPALMLRGPDVAEALAAIGDFADLASPYLVGHAAGVAELAVAAAQSLGLAGACHHERLDGSGYHRGATAAALTPPARLLAAADAYHAMTEPRPHERRCRPGRRPTCSARKPARGGWTPTASARCWPRPGTPLDRCRARPG